MSLRRHSTRRLRAFLFLVLGGLILNLLPKPSLASTDFSYKTDITYKVDGSGSTTVTQHYTVTNNSATKYLDSIALSAPTDDVSGIKVVYGVGGEAIDFSTTDKSTSSQGYNYDYREVSIKFPNKQVGRGKSWDFTMSYHTAKLVEVKGTAQTVYIPAIAQSGDSDEYNVTLSVPQSFGLPKSSGVKPSSGGIEDGQAIYTFSKEDLARQSVALVFGDSTVYKVNFNFPLKNTTNRTKNFTVTLPPDTSSQKIYINQLDPKPTDTRLDADGNVLADYTVPPNSDITVKTNIAAEVKYIEYDLSAGGTKKDIPQELISRYTGATKYWQAADPDVVIKSQTAVGGNQKVVDIVKTINKVVIDTLTYNNEKIKYNVRQGAEKALHNPNNAVCLEYSDLMIAMLRAQGIPARMPVGYAYSGNLKTSRAVSDSLHSWVEAYIPGVGWVNVDPTWGEKFDNFGKSDLDHFSFAVWGSSDNAPAAVTENGNDTNYQYEGTEISYVKETPAPDVSSKVTATKWVFLPFLSFVQYSVIAPANVSGDDYKLKLRTNSSESEISLGSLAPAQKIGGWVMSAGSTFVAATNLQFYSGAKADQMLAGTNASANFLPLLMIIGFIALFALVFLIKWAIRRKYSKSKSDDPRDRPAEAANLDEVRESFTSKLEEAKKSAGDEDPEKLPDGLGSIKTDDA